MKRENPFGWGVLFVVLFACSVAAEPQEATPEMKSKGPSVPEAAQPKPIAHWATIPSSGTSTPEVDVEAPSAAMPQRLVREETSEEKEPPIIDIPPWKELKIRILGIDRTEFPEMLVVFSVKDYEGKPVMRMVPDFLEITEDEAPQAITSLAPCVPGQLPGEPLTLMLLMDSSGSMQRYIDVVQTAAARFVERFREDDRAGVVAFCNQPVVLTELTNNQKKLKKGIYNVRLRGFTALYDSVYLGLQMLSPCGGRRAIILVTDGKDDDGTGAQLSRRSLDEVLAAAKKWKIPVFVVGIGHEISQRVLEKMGNETGGDFLFAPTGDEVDGLYKEVARLLGRGDEGYYKATYRASADEKDGTQRTVIVRYENASGRAEYPAPRTLFWPLSKVVD